MKHRIFLLSFLSILSSPSFAGINAANGFYLGGDVTMSRYDTVKGAAFDSSFIPIAGYIRPYIGYRFTDYAAIETGYDYLVNDSHSAGRHVTDIFGHQKLSGPDHYKLSALDIAAKAIYPFANGISIYGKAGVALVHQDVFNQTFQDSTPTVNTNSTRLLPLVGVGASYNFTQQLAVEASYTHMQKISSIGNIDMMGIGLSYTFGA